MGNMPELEIQPDLPFPPLVQAIQEEIVDDAENDDAVPDIHYSITSFGADYDVEGLVKRLDRGDIIIPDFQRKYVWKLKEASQFIESLLLGLPVPGVFFAREQDTNKLLVIDGQQRLKTLQFFYQGLFNPKGDDKTARIFRLLDVQDRFENMTFEELSDSDQIRLNDSLIHATIIKQEMPENSNTSIYHIFDRLNSTGSKLSPQEIRAAIYHGPFMEMLKHLNQNSNWRNLVGPVNQRLKDQELILRFFAMADEWSRYTRPMEDYLSKYIARHKNISQQQVESMSERFDKSIRFLNETIGRTAFRPSRTVNTAVLDSVMVATDILINRGVDVDLDKFRNSHGDLLSDEKYIAAVSRATANEESVDNRMKKAIEYLNDSQ